LLTAGCGGGDSDEAGSLVFSDDSYIVLENVGSLSISVNRIYGSTGTVTVEYATQGYALAFGTLTFLDGVTSRTISIPISNNYVVNDDETFNLILSNPLGGASLGIPSIASVTILDDESLPIYDFEALNLGDINGRDNWAEAETNATIVDDFLVNDTQVVRPNVVSGLPDGTELTRVNDVNFSYASFIRGGEAEIWFDATADDIAVFSLGRDIDGDGFLRTEDDEIGVPFGFYAQRFAIFTGNNLGVRAGEADLGENNLATDWYRLRLRIDFAANSGDGSASLSYMNLSNGEASFTDVPGLQDLNLKLLFNQAPDEAGWNAMFLKLRADAGNIPKVDNLIPNMPINP